ncbi:MAG: tetratricopeptide repeat protein [Oligoflexia bacterium]|nr:tetratricopeptide repeat protein [Oligoflexia bacterium]
MISYLLFAQLAFASAELDQVVVAKAIKEAESLSLAHDRELATTVLVRNIRKVGKSGQKKLKEKIKSLSKFFYTDKGLQEFQLAQELVEKGQYAEALERLVIADQTEKGNVAVLELMARTELELKKPSSALKNLDRAFTMDPYSSELLRLKYFAYLEAEEFQKILDELGDLSVEHSDGTLKKFRAQALIGLGKASEALAVLKEIKENQQVDVHYLLSKADVAEKKTEHIKKYLKSCTQRPEKTLSVFDPCRYAAELRKDTEL